MVIYKVRGDVRAFNEIVEMSPCSTGYWWEDEFCNSMAELLQKGGQLVWLEDIPEIEEIESDADILIYEYRKNVSGKEEPVFPTSFSLKGQYIMNIDKRLYLDCDAYYENNCFEKDRKLMCPHPIPLLTARSEWFQGFWAGDVIKVVDDIPPYYKGVTDIASCERRF